MKNWIKLSGIVLLSATSAFADGKLVSIQGSDTLAGAMTDAVIAAGLNTQMAYVGGGSGLAETAMLNGTQAIGPMSREVKPEAAALALKGGFEFVPHVLGLDGIGLFVSSSNRSATIDIAMAVKIFSCATTRWEQLPNSRMTGAIKVYRRNDQSGTTDAFKNLTGLKTFGPCVTVVAETADIANVTSTDALAIGYAGMSAKRDGNKALAVSKNGGQAIAPTVATIREFTYPLARKLFIYEVKGSRTPSAVESQFLNAVTDRSFMDPIMQANEFYTID